MKQEKPERVTLRDVAEMAGVSYQTVSRVINNSPHVATHTRAKVLRAIEKLDYRPNRAAQVLTTGRSYILQLVVTHFQLWSPMPSMLYWAGERGYTIAVTELQEPDSPAAMRKVLMQSARIIDGLLLMSPTPHLSYAELRELCQGRPFVLVSTQLGARMPSVVFDQRYGTQQALEHLLELGHRRIVEIHGPQHHFDARLRHETLVEWLGEHGLEPAAILEGDFSAASGYCATRKLLEAGTPFTALFAANDKMALGAIRALREVGRQVPGDVSVVGFDDLEEAAYFVPPLTTVRQDFDALGKQSVEYLVALIEQPDTPVQQRVLYPELVVRSSTGPAPQ